MGGAGRATELLLRGLSELRPPGEWLLWGSNIENDHLWDSARAYPLPAAPTAVWGQRSIFVVPENDLAVYMHQIRPLRRGPSLTLVHDTIPLRYGGLPPLRWAKRTFMRRTAALSTHILVPSEFSKASIVRDLNVPAARVTVVHYPVDSELVTRVTKLRKKLPPRDSILYLGRFGAHKNLERLIIAFTTTRFSEKGGSLLLVGGNRVEVERLQRFVIQQGVERVSIEGFADQDRIDELYATCLMLVMPSLEEGFGFPVWEAMCCGLPVCVSERGSLPEVAGEGVELFTPGSIPAIANALDRAIEPSRRNPRAGSPDIPRRPRERDFAEEVVEVVGRYLRATRVKKKGR